MTRRDPDVDAVRALRNVLVASTLVRTREPSMSRYEEKPHVSKTRAARSATETAAPSPRYPRRARVAAARHENASSNPFIPAMADTRVNTWQR